MRAWRLGFGICIGGVLVVAAAACEDSGKPQAYPDAAGRSGGGATLEGPSEGGGQYGGHDAPLVGGAQPFSGSPGGAMGELEESSGAGGSGGGGVESGGVGGQSGDGGGLAPPAERWLAFRLERPDNRHPLFLAPLPSPVAPVLVDSDVESFEWSADGAHLVYVTPPSNSAASDAYIVDVSPNGISKPRLLHHPLELASDRVLNASLSPDGHHVALRLLEAGVSRWYVSDISGSVDDWRHVGLGAANNRAAESGRDFSWSPDSDRFAFLDGDSSDEIFLVELGGTETQVTSIDPVLLEWSHDSAYLLVDGLYYPPLQQRALFLIGPSAAFEVATITEPSVYTNFSLAHFSPNDASVVFKAKREGAYDVFTASTSANEQALIIDGINGLDARWLPGSELLAYWGYATEDVTGPHLFTVRKDGSAFTRLNPPGTLAHCNVAPCFRLTDDAIVFTTLDDAQTGNQLYEASGDPSAPDVRTVTSFPPETFVDAFEIAPDSSQIFMITSTPTAHQLYLVRRSEAPEVRLAAELPLEAAPFSYGADGPSWSNDSRFIYYAANPDLHAEGTADLFVIDLGDDQPTSPVRVTTNSTAVSITGVRWQP